MRQLSGLSLNQVTQSRMQHGKNMIASKQRFSALKLLLAQFVSPMMMVLMVAGIVSYFLHGISDAIIVWGAVVLNAILGFYQEYRAEKSLQALERIVEVSTEVMRQGRRTTIPLTEVVVGDMCYLKAGDKVPGDAVVLESNALTMNEAMLTGESSPVSKIGGRDDEVYMGTSVVTGLATIRIVRVGVKTKMGRIAESLKVSERTPTNLQEELSKFAKILTGVVVVVATLLFIVGLVRGMETREIFLVSVAVAVSAVPEGLAVTLTVILSVGMQKLLKRKGLVRKLLVAEALGKVSIVCADKTGTLTTGEMKVVRAIGPEQTIAEAGLLGDDMADAIETAVSTWARSKCDMKGWNRLSTIPFDSHKKYGASASGNKTEARFVLRGAPEVVMEYCRLNSAQKKDWTKQITTLASEGYRIIAVAEYRDKNIPVDPEAKLGEIIKQKRWEYLGLIIMEDPIRTNVRSDIDRLQKLGIRFCVITGDFVQTAQYVMQKLGIDVEGKTITGAEFTMMDDKTQQQAVKETILFARFAPEEKLRVVEILKAQGEVVAMMGDGINDAPALQRADVGIVVSSASEVSKETSDMILLNNQFSTVIAGIEEGRSIFERIKRIMRYLLSDSFDEVIVVSVSILIGLPLPVTAVQILWINLANDTFPAMALAFDRVSPRRMSTSSGVIRGFFDLQSKLLVGVVSVVSGLLVIAMFTWSLSSGHDLNYARTLAFTFLGINTLFCGIGIMMQVMAVYLSPLQKMLGTVPLRTNDWLIIAAGTAGVIMSIEMIKPIMKRLVVV